MTIVFVQMSVSLDGCYAGAPHDGSGSWLESDEALRFFRVTRWATAAFAWRQRQGLAGGETSVDSEAIDEVQQRSGAYVMGRRLYDGGEVPWGEEPPFQAPVFVVTHRERDVVQRGRTRFEFVTDGVAAAIERATAAAGGKDVCVSGGGLFARQAIASGLVHELDLHVVPVILGGGSRLFDLELPDGQALELEPVRTIVTPDVTHARYRVLGPRPLVLDDRGGALPAD